MGDSHEEANPVGQEEGRQAQPETDHAALARGREAEQGETLREAEGGSDDPLSRKEGDR